jgi:hypothetical protein
MPKRLPQTAAAVTATAAAAFAAYTVGSQSGDGSAVAARDSSGTTSMASGARFAAAGGREHAGLSGLASRLGVSEARLRAALDELRDSGAGPRSEVRDELLSALAAELGVDADRLRDAFETVRRNGALRRDGDPRRHGPAREGALAGALADELNLDAAKARAALRKVHDAAHDRRRDELAAALASSIGVDKDKVAAALDDLFDRDRRDGRRGTRRDPAVALAAALGVDVAKVRAAFEELRRAHERDHAQRRAEFARRLADELGISVDKVEDALEAGSRPGFGRGPGGHHGPGGRGFPGP